MADVTISGLPNAATLTGTERVPMDQGGVTVDATTAAIAATLPNSSGSVAGKMTPTQFNRLADTPVSSITGLPGALRITKIVSMSQASYDARPILADDATTLFIVP
jgi:hypothetical protein